MKLLHHPESELSRTLLATKPHHSDCAVNNGPALEPGPCDCNYVEVIEGPGDYAVSAYPSVVIDVPAYSERRRYYDENGNLAGIADCIVPAHEEVLRSPISWEVVNAIIDDYNACAVGLGY